MELEGVVQNGLIVPDDATGLAEGTRVRIGTMTPATTDAVAMLRRWAAEDERLTDAEAAENADVLRAIDAARPSYRKLFADVLAGDRT
jgi:hypothetical protein